MLKSIDGLGQRRRVVGQGLGRGGAGSWSARTAAAAFSASVVSGLGHDADRGSGKAGSSGRRTWGSQACPSWRSREVSAPAAVHGGAIARGHEQERQRTVRVRRCAQCGTGVLRPCRSAWRSTRSCRWCRRAGQADGVEGHDERPRTGRAMTALCHGVSAQTMPDSLRNHCADICTGAAGGRVRLERPARLPRRGPHRAADDGRRAHGRWTTPPCRGASRRWSTVCGARLFDRSPTGYALTAHGETPDAHGRGDGEPDGAGARRTSARRTRR